MTGAMALAGKRKQRVVTARTPSGLLLVSDVENRALRACKTLRALPDKDRAFQVLRNSWPEIVHDADDAYGYEEEVMPRFRPTPADVSDFLTALSWARAIPRRDFKLVWWRSFGISFRHIGLRLGRSDETARMRYRDAILGIWYEANRQAATRNVSAA